VFRGCNGLDRASDIKFLDRLVEVQDGGMRIVVGAKDLLGFLVLVGLVNVRHCGHTLRRSPILAREDLPVKMARAFSSRKSRRVTRVPALSFKLETCSEDTSRVMGMGNSVPSARRSVSRMLFAPTY
jgi:hypothetical protein